MAEFSTPDLEVTADYLINNGVWNTAFRGTSFLSGSRQRRNMIQHLLNNSNYQNKIPIELLTCIYTVHGVASGFLGDSNISSTGTLRSSRIEEFQRAYARQRALTIQLLKNYATQGSEYALGQISVWSPDFDNIMEMSPYDWPCFTDAMFNQATTDGRRFDGDLVRWPGYLLANREAYVDRLMANRESMVGLLTKSELRDLMTSVNYNCAFAKKLIVPLYEDLYSQALENSEGDEEFADAAAVVMIRGQLDSLVGEGQSNQFLEFLPSSIVSSGVDFSFLIDSLGPEDWLDLDEFIDESLTSGDIKTE